MDGRQRGWLDYGRGGSKRLRKRNGRDFGFRKRRRRACRACQRRWPELHSYPGPRTRDAVARTNAGARAGPGLQHRHRRRALRSQRRHRLRSQHHHRRHHRPATAASAASAASTQDDGFRWDDFGCLRPVS